MPLGLNLFRHALTIVIAHGLLACGGGLRKSGVGSYEGFFDSFTLSKEGKFSYRSIPSPNDRRLIELEGSFTEKFDAAAADEDEHRGELDIVLTTVKLDGQTVDSVPFGPSCPNFCEQLKTGATNLGWWVHDFDLTSDRSEMGLHLNKAGELRSPPYGSFKIWAGNPTD